MEVAAALLLERNVKGLGVKLTARISITDDGPKARDEQNSCFLQSLHGASSAYGEHSRSRDPGNEFSSRHTSKG
jgi:hypothetical protein